VESPKQKKRRKLRRVESESGKEEREKGWSRVDEAERGEEGRGKI
jgi:hypothetical protein